MTHVTLRHTAALRNVFPAIMHTRFSPPQSSAGLIHLHISFSYLPMYRTYLFCLFLGFTFYPYTTQRPLIFMIYSLEAAIQTQFNSSK